MDHISDPGVALLGVRGVGAFGWTGTRSFAWYAAGDRPNSLWGSDWFCRVRPAAAMIKV